MSRTTVYHGRICLTRSLGWMTTSEEGMFFHCAIWRSISFTTAMESARFLSTPFLSRLKVLASLMNLSRLAIERSWVDPRRRSLSVVHCSGLLGLMSRPLLAHVRGLLSRSPRAIARNASCIFRKESGVLTENSVLIVRSVLLPVRPVPLSPRPYSAFE